MAIWDFDQWSGNNDTAWLNTVIAGGPITVTAGEKHIAGSGFLINQLGFSRNKAIFTLTDMIFEIDMRFSPDTGTPITLCTLSASSGLQSSGGCAILFNAFPTPHIQFNDSNQDPVVGGTVVNALAVDTLYRPQMKINSDGTVTGFITGNGEDQTDLGTTSLITNFHNANLYFSAQQTLITLEAESSIWDEYFVHTNGLSFAKEEFMAYANVANVESEFHGITFGAATPITSAEVTDFTERYSAFVDSKISNKYAVPVDTATATESAHILREIVVLLCVSKIKRILKIGGGQKESSQIDESNEAHKRAMAMIKGIKSGMLELTDAAKATPTADSYGRETSLAQTFEWDVDQW